MKTSAAVYAKILSSFFLSALLQSSALAQSGKVIPAPTSKPTPSPETVAPNQAETKPRVAIESADTYKLVFPTVPGVDNFGEQLNRAGVDRYKLTSAVFTRQRQSTPPKDVYSFPVAILKLGKVQHEYAWFKTSSTSIVAVDGFEPKYWKLSQQGFHLVDQLLTKSSCDSGESILDVACEVNHLFLLERQRGVEKPIEFILARSHPIGIKMKMPRELTAQVKEKLVEGFYPTAVFSAWEVLLTQAENREDLADNPDVQVVTSFDVRGRVNDLAKRGYRLVLINKRGAVMYRRGQTTTPLTYISLKVADKHFDEQLAKLQETGAIYRMTYIGDSGIEDQLMFEQGPVATDQRYEYKVLNLEFQIVEDVALGQGGQPGVRIELTPSSTETMKLLNSLAKEGFVVRDLFIPKELMTTVSVLLERTH
jgi:hypothetical protein